MIIRKDERRIFLKGFLSTLGVFITAIIIQFGIVLDDTQPIYLILPLVFGTGAGFFVGSLLVMRHRLRRSSQAKSEFITRMSHELRTPLTVILGNSRLLTGLWADRMGREEFERVVAVQSAGDHMLKLMDDLLDLAKIEAGALAIDMGTVDIGEIVEESIELVAVLADERRITIDYVDHVPQASLVRGNRMRLKQVLINLLSNAVKYNREGGRIFVSKKAIPGQRVQLTIGDTGPGIPPQEVARLFQPFSRIGIRDEYVPGTGIGLAISRQLLRVMGGEVALLETSPSGTVFAVELDATEP